MDQELLGQLDDGAVGAADMLAGTALGAQTRDDLDDEVNLVGQQGVEVDECLGGQLRQLDVGGETGVVGEPGAMLGEALAQGLLGRGVLGQDALTGDLGDVAGL